MLRARVTIKGFDELRRKLSPNLIAGPARRLHERWTISTQGKAREFAPVFRGQLRGSIDREIDSAFVPLYSRVGTNEEHGPAQEFGLPKGHFPPPDALEVWARRKGFPPGGGFLVARAIARRGMKGKRYLGRAVEETTPRVPALVERMAREIESEAEAG